MEQLETMLTQMPHQAVLLDLRQRLLYRHASLFAALSELGTAPSQGQLAPPERGSALSSRRAHIGVVELEAAEIDAVLDMGAVVVDGDDVATLREALRGVAPAVGLEGFWQRFVAEWPEVTGLALGSRQAQEADAAAAGLHEAAERLAELLPEDPGLRCEAAVSLALPRAGSRSLPCLTEASFDALAAQLDVSRPVAAELFGRLLDAAGALRGRAAPQDETLPGALGAGAAKEVYLEDFAELLQLWTESPLVSLPGGSESAGNGGGKSAARRNLQQVVASAQAAVNAFKAELSHPLAGPAAEGAEPIDSDAVPVKMRRRPTRPVLPWRSHSRTPTPMFRS